MNVNWKNAILQAQLKIDQVLDIKPEPDDDELQEPAQVESPLTQELVNEVFLLEPMLQRKIEISPLFQI